MGICDSFCSLSQDACQTWMVPYKDSNLVGLETTSIAFRVEIAPSDTQSTYGSHKVGVGHNFVKC